MVNLDLKIGDVNDSNNGLIGGLGKDVGSLVSKSAGAVGNVFTPSLANIAQNTSKLTRNPWKTLTTGSSWGKFFKTFPAAAADLTAKTMSLPFRTLEGALTHGVANNVERLVSTGKGITTDAARNWFHNGGQANGFMRGMGHLVGGAGDLVGSAAKLSVFIPEWTIKKVNNVAIRPLISTTEGWAKNQRLDGVNYWEPNLFENTDYSPVAANNNAEPARAVA